MERVAGAVWPVCGLPGTTGGEFGGWCWVVCGENVCSVARLRDNRWCVVCVEYGRWGK